MKQSRQKWKIRIGIYEKNQLRILEIKNIIIEMKIQQRIKSTMVLVDKKINGLEHNSFVWRIQLECITEKMS